MVSRLLYICTTFVSASAFLASAGTGQENRQTITIDHLSSQESAYTLYLENEEQFDVEITNACPQWFEYAIRGIAEAQPGRRAGTAEQPRIMTVTHNGQYGGYIVTISERSSGQACEEGHVPKSFIIFTPDTGLALEVAGGFTINGLTDPVFSLGTDPHNSANRVISSDSIKGDDVALDLGAFAYFYHRQTWSWLAGVFGLGWAESEAQYYGGLGVRLGRVGIVSGGIVYGPVARLPAGSFVGQQTNDPNVLSDLPTKNRRSWFVSISLSIINNVDDRFRKPFGGTGQ